MKSFSQKIVAITGAGAGIGRALALEFAKEGAKIAISDINKAALKETASLLEAHHIKPLVSIVDVSDKEAMHHWAKQVVDYFGGVHVIVNNAGVVVANPVDQIADEEFEWVMQINFWGCVNGVNAFLPYISAQQEGHIANVSSILGLLATPMLAAYASSKYAVRGYSDALRIELMQTHPTVGVTCIFPCGIETKLLKNGRGADIATIERMFASKYTKKISTEAAAKIMLHAIKKNKARALVGPNSMIIDLFQRLIPNSYHKLILSIQNYMMHKSKM